MVDSEALNDLYNILDLYIVTSRLEGGPQAILECAISKTPILSTDVGVASEILNKNSIFKINQFEKAKVDIEYAYKNSLNYIIPIGMKKYNNMFKEVYES
jgi:glycosyltransferase involved in cell wall biosynthesis